MTTEGGDMVTGLLGVLSTAPRVGWKEAFAAAAAALGGAISLKTPPAAGVVFRATLACGAGGLVAALVEQQDQARVPQLVLSGIVGSLLGFLVTRWFTRTRSTS